MIYRSRSKNINSLSKNKIRSRLEEKKYENTDSEIDWTVSLSVEHQTNQVKMDQNIWNTYVYLVYLDFMFIHNHIPCQIK